MQRKKFTEREIGKNFMWKKFADSIGMQYANLVGPLDRQLNQYVEAVWQHTAVDRQGATERHRELVMLYFTWREYLATREERIRDIASPEMQAVYRIKQRLFPAGEPPKLILCTDGRVFPKAFADLQGNALRSPAGESGDFLPAADGSLFLSRKSDFARIINEAFKDKNLLTEVFDSHIGCLARSGQEAAKHDGVEPADKGLYADVVKKKKKIAALQAYVRETFGGDKEIICFQTSFDPHDGNLLMGFDKEECLNDNRALAEGFTTRVCKRLLTERKIISAKHLAGQVPKLKKLFAAARQRFDAGNFRIDYENKYRESSLRFWQCIEAVSPVAVPLIERELCVVFPGLADETRYKELRKRALLLLANAFDKYLRRGVWPYDSHDESIIVATRSEKAPFRSVRAFALYQSDPKLPEHVVFDASLIRMNRRAKRYSKTEAAMIKKLYSGKTDAFVKDAVPLVLFERAKKELKSADIKRLQQADWSAIAELPWLTMSDSEFIAYLARIVPEISPVALNGINDLRHLAMRLYDPDSDSAEVLLSGAIVPLWVLAAPDRTAIALLPFIASGYPKNYQRER